MALAPNGGRPIFVMHGEAARPCDVGSFDPSKGAFVEFAEVVQRRLPGPLPGRFARIG